MSQNATLDISTKIAFNSRSSGVVSCYLGYRVPKVVA
uniref:Uncharacterized protein n=1 Tax=Rhizophora mucronata TaxID=61149 RepID=A0A2P2N251_RHIMU